MTLVIALLNLWDLWTTYTMIETWGCACELNPFVCLVWSHWGVWGLVLLKVVAVAGFGWGVRLLKDGPKWCSRVVQIPPLLFYLAVGLNQLLAVYPLLWGY